MSGASATGDAAVTAVKNFCEGGSFNPGGVDGCTGVVDDIAVDGRRSTSLEHPSNFS
jgi:hypothetical protein